MKKIKSRGIRLVSVLLSVLIVTSVFTALPVTAADNKCGENLTWSIYDNVLRIDGSGEMYDFASFSQTPWHSDILKIKSVVVEYGVTKIGANAFNSMKRLESVKLPSSVSTIGDGAFMDCYSLSDIELPFMLEAISDDMFNGCISLDKLNIPNNVTSIGDNAFNACVCVEQLIIPENVLHIGNDIALTNSLETVAFNGNCNDIAPNAFSGVGASGAAKLALPDNWNGTYPDSSGNWYGGSFDIAYSVKFYTSYDVPNVPTQYVRSGEYAVDPAVSDGFAYDGFVYEVKGWEYYPPSSNVFEPFDFNTIAITCNTELYDDVTHLPHGSCGDGLEWRVKDNTLTVRGSGTIDRPNEWDDYAESVQSVIVEEGVLGTGYGAFSGFSSLTDVTLPNSLVTLGDYAFSNCKNISSVTLPQNLTAIGEGAFMSSGIKSIVVPYGVKTIGTIAFTNCILLTGVSLPDTVTDIGAYAFAYCIFLHTVNIPAGLTTIAPNTFYACASLNRITIPEGVTSIGYEAFEECQYLYSITIPKSVTSIGNNAFLGCRNLYINCTPGSAAQLYADKNDHNYAIAINESNFPDSSFRDFVSQYQTENNGYLYKRNINPVTEMTVSDTTDITSLKGIEAFIKLKSLDCSNLALTSLDVSGLDLDYLDCYGNHIEQLKLYDRPQSFMADNQTKDDVLISGWYLDSGFTTQVTDDTSLKNKTIYAKFATYPIIYINGDHGSITGVDYADPGDTVQLDIAPDTGYEVDDLLVIDSNWQSISVTDDFTFVMPGSKVNVGVSFKQCDYSIIYSDFANGTVTGPESAHYGDTVVLNVQPDDQYRLASLYVRDGSGSNVDMLDDGQSFVMPDTDVTVYAEFEPYPTPYTIIVSQDCEHGTIRADKQTAFPGETVSLTTSSEKGYVVDKITVTDKNNNNIVVTNVRTFTMPSSDVTVSATFKKFNFRIVYNDFTNGMVTGPSSAQYGDTVTLNIMPDENYKLGTFFVRDGGGRYIDLLSDGRSFIMPNNNVGVYATFEPLTEYYDITIPGNNNGKITADRQTAAVGDTVTLTVSPYTGYELDTLSVKDSSNADVAVTGNTFVMPQSAVTVTAVFTKTNYPITYTHSEHGTVTGPATATYGDWVHLSSTEEKGWQLFAVNAIDENSVPRTVYSNSSFLMPASGVTVTPVFRERTAYVAYDSATKTLAFRYDAHKADAEKSWELTALTGEPAWSGENVTRVVINEAFADVKPESTAYWFYDLKDVTEIEGLQYLDTSAVTDMQNMFYGCGSLTTLDLSGFDTSNVTGMNEMFCYCDDLTSLDVGSFNTSKVTDMTCMFENCRSVTTLDISDFDTSKVTDTTRMFFGCVDLETLDMSGCDLRAAVRMSDMFYNCRNLTTLDLTGVKTQNAANMASMFDRCESLTSLDLSGFETDNAIYMSGMFYGCKRLTDLDLRSFNTSNVTDMSAMFQNCSSLVTINAGDGWNTSSVTNSRQMFYGCLSLTGGLGTTYDLNCTDKTYARVDGGADSKGYLTGTYYTVTWKNDDGSVIDTTVVLSGTVPSHEALARRIDSEYIYTFTGWDPEPVPATADAEYTAVFSQKPKNYIFENGVLTLLNGNFSAAEKWGDDVVSSQVTSVAANSGVRLTGDCKALFQGFINCTTIDLSNADTSGVTDMSYMFASCTSLVSVDLSGFGTANVVNMSDMFNTCTALEQLDLGSFNTSEVVNMNGMFYYCTSVQTIKVGNGWNTDKVVMSEAMFNNCSSLTGSKGTGYNYNYVTKAYAHIDGGADNPGYLTGIPYTITWKNYNGEVIDTTRVACGDMPAHRAPVRENDETYTYTFAGWEPELTAVTGDAEYTATYSQALKNYRYDSETKVLTLLWGDFSSRYKWGRDVPASEVLAVTAEEGVRFTGDCALLFNGFSSCLYIDLSNIDTSEMTNTAMMFNGCTSLELLYFQGFNTSSVTDMTSMFERCESLTAIDLSSFNTSSVQSMSRMFLGCQGLTSLDLSSFDTSAVTNASNMFMLCNALTSITVGDGWSSDGFTDSADMFANCQSLTGGMGTTYDPQNVNGAYAHVDGGVQDPGYLTAANAQYEITWKNYDGSVLAVSYAGDGELPTYSGSTPQKPSDGEYSYVFTGWSPEVYPVRQDTTYTAVFAKRTTVSYIDENGTEQTVTATVITGDESQLGSGWYAVTEDVVLNNRLTFSENAKLILCDGKTLSFNNADDIATVIGSDLSIYGQQNGTGTLKFTSGSESGQMLYADSLSLYGGAIVSDGNNDLILTTDSAEICGGSVQNAALMSFNTVTVNGGNVLIDTEAFDYAIAASGNVEINGGTVFASGISDGIYSSNGIINLSRTNEDDSIFADSYSGSVELKKDFADIDENVFEAGAVEDNSTLAGVRLFAPHTHAYGDPAWSWASDNSSATAVFTCAVCGHTESESADSDCELIDHICTAPGSNKYTVTVTFEEDDYSDTKTVEVQAVQHSYDEGKTILQVHCMRDGLTRYTCTACGTTMDETVPCPGEHNWTEREISYEEYEEEIENEPAGANMHHDCESVGSAENTFILKECINAGCDTKLVVMPDGTKVVRVGEDSWSKDASTCQSAGDVSTLASSLAGEIAALGASTGVLGSLKAALSGFGGILALFAGAVGTITVVTIKFSLDKRSSNNNECDHDKVRTTTKNPTCTESGQYRIECRICGRVFDTGSISPLGHSWGSWTLADYDEDTMTSVRTRRCERCKKKEEERPRIAIADLMIQYSDDGENYINDVYSIDGTGQHCKCSVTFTDFGSWISCSPTHAVDYESSGSFTFTAEEKNGYEFTGWYRSDGSKLTDVSHASAVKRGKNVYYARFKKRTLEFEYKIYDDSDKSGGSAKSGKLKIEVNGNNFEKSFAYDTSSYKLTIGNEYLTSDSEFKITLTAEPDDKCAFIKDVRTDYWDGAVEGQKNRTVSSASDDDIHVMKKTEHTYTVKMSELLDENGKQKINKVQYATDLEKGIKISVDKTDVTRFFGSTTKIKYKLDGKDTWKDATDGVTMIYKSGDKFTVSASEGVKVSFDGWREGKKILTNDAEYSSTVYADATYTPVFRSDVLHVNYVDMFDNFIAQKEIGEKAPDPFGYAGYEFTGWDKEPTEIVEDGEKVTALYKKVRDKVTVTAEDCIITGLSDSRSKTALDTLTVDFDTPVTVQKDGAACWVIDGKIVCYGDSYTFRANVDVTVIPVEETTEGEKPQVTIISVEQRDNTYHIEFLATRYIPDDCTFIQAGFVYGKDLTDSDLDLDNVGKQGSNENSGKIKAAYCGSTENNEVFYLEYGVANMDAPATAKAFVSYSDKDGNIKILYSDIAVFEYEKGEE